MIRLKQNSRFYFRHSWFFVFFFLIPVVSHGQETQQPLPTNLYLTVGLGGIAGTGQNGMLFKYWAMSCRFGASLFSDSFHLEGGLDHFGYNAWILMAKYQPFYQKGKWGVALGLGFSKVTPWSDWDETTEGYEPDPRAGTHFSAVYLVPSIAFTLPIGDDLSLKWEGLYFKGSEQRIIESVLGFVTYF